MKDIINLLSSVSEITRKNGEILDAIGGRFNIFSVLGVNHYENTHSSILSELINPKGSHGLDYKFLEKFCELVKLDEYVIGFNFKNAKAKTEVSAGISGRIDLLIEDNMNHAIIIENKIYAGDQWEQLKRYNHFATKKYGEGNYKILYLTLQGSQASLNSGENVDYLPVSYANDIIPWLEECVNISSRYPFVRETLNQYINHIKKLTNQDMDSKNSQELVNLLSKPENIDAAFIICKNYSSLCKSVIEKAIQDKLKPQLEKFAEENGLTIFEIYGKETEVKIVFEKYNWEKCRMILHTEGTNLIGFIYKNREDKLAEISVEAVKKHFSTSNTSDWWPIWMKTDKYKYINMDIWRNEISNGDFGEYIVKAFTELVKIAGIHHI